MKDYWNELSLSEVWSKRERFNFILNYLDEKLDSNNPTTEPEVIVEPEIPEPVVTKADINVSIKDVNDNGINGAVVEVTQGNTSLFLSNTGSAGGCTIRDVPLGDYVIHTSATGYIESYDDFTVVDGENNFSLVLEEEVDVGYEEATFEDG